MYSQQFQAENNWDPVKAAAVGGRSPALFDFSITSSHIFLDQPEAGPGTNLA
jgi:hypothetical protein